MSAKTGESFWEGTLMGGHGTIRVKSGLFNSPYNAAMRFQDEPGTNPEELIGAAHAGCFSMQFAHLLAQSGFTAEKIHSRSKVHIEKQNDGYTITKIERYTEAVVPGITKEIFMQQALKAKDTCPVSKALSVPISLEASLTDEIQQ
ncbi:MAG TPA: OsmC family peroxiredoxin [Chitinispirillaceae bacterium]|jgi:osmotically inducible protein OsmC|nr:OsmC family peroxiredoxin [Chitinispirillaceae bacterium]